MPTATDKLFGEFPAVSTAEWEAAVARDLKGGDPQKLLWKTDEGIAVKPFYRSEDLPELAAERRRIQKGWRIRFEISEPDPAAARALADRALEQGAHEVGFTGTKLASSDDVRTLTRGLDAPVHFRFGDDAGRLLEILPTGLKGSLDYDPVLQGAQMSPTARKFFGSDFSALAVRADAWHNSGATAVEELAFSLGAAAHYVREAGDLAARELVFNFASGGNYFFEIAKLRAARRLWAVLYPAYPMRIHSRTSLWNKTVYDAHNNLLRATTEAMSAAIGGADSITVGAFEEPFRRPGSSSSHLALNTQLILRDEAHFDKVADPAAGAWYIEWLTDQVAREARRLLDQIESDGGLAAAIKSGFVEQTLAKSRQAKAAAIAQRRRVLVGTNQYPNPREKALDQIEALVPGRAAEPFEQVRLTTERYTARTGRTPVVLLLTYGDVKMRRARADFVTNFFASGGFAVSEPSAFPAPEAAAEHASAAPADLIVLCSSDAEYPALAAGVLPKLTSKTPVLIAGLPKDSVEQLKAAGVRDFIHIKSDVIATLRQWQKELGVTE
jgi:methylmalonyl-CoA mutase